MMELLLPIGALVSLIDFVLILIAIWLLYRQSVWQSTAREVVLSELLQSAHDLAARATEMEHLARARYEAADQQLTRIDQKIMGAAAAATQAAAQAVSEAARNATSNDITLPAKASEPDKE